MSTITTEQEQAIRDTLAGMPDIPVGVGDEEAACSVAAINLALSGELTDRIPECMSKVIGAWIIAVQDRMPAKTRNSVEWRELLPLAAGTGRELEAERLTAIMEWMWAALETLQGVADRDGYGVAWRTMLDERTNAAAHAAANAAHAAANVAASAAHAAADAAVRAAADAAACAASAAEAAAHTGGTDWPTLDPASLLRRLIQIGGKA